MPSVVACLWVQGIVMIVLHVGIQHSAYSNTGTMGFFLRDYTTYTPLL